MRNLKLRTDNPTGHIGVAIKYGKYYAHAQRNGERLFAGYFDTIEEAIEARIEMNKIFVYRTVARQKPSLTVLYGSFGDRREAQQALNELPASLKAYRPILRTVQGIRGEMRQHQTNEQSGSTSS